ncbi:MAG: hypothetical protein H6644_03470 [Caldilineaceae bacterium]|nr:hypothetical protein [Caldilineaceae bacterium]
MNTTMGEYATGAYLKLILECDVVDYNVRPPGGGLEGLAEFDVVGLRFTDSTAFMCEVTTHLHGVSHARGNRQMVESITSKHMRQQQYAEKHLHHFDSVRFMYWAPVVSRGYITEQLAQIDSLELVINGAYKQRIEELRTLAKQTAHDTGNPFFRTLQILERLRD